MAMFQQGGRVLTCRVAECAFNEREECRARRIEVGLHAICDTFTTVAAREHGEEMAHVEGCDALICAFNKDRVCEAPGITVDHHEQHADCLTFRPMVVVQAGRERGL